MRPTLDSDLLRTFVAIAETGNFTKAAEQAGRTQSAVSMQMKKLEELIGASLFERGSRGVA
ncbi:LysR family transcriptional regulator, partial [Mesorhizobium sp. M7A.F.Ca.ET.027.02.1.1]